MQWEIAHKLQLQNITPQYEAIVDGSILEKFQ